MRRTMSRAQLLVERLDTVLEIMTSDGDTEGEDKTPSSSQSPSVIGGDLGLRSQLGASYTSKNPNIQRDMRIDTIKDAHLQQDRKQQELIRASDTDTLNKFHTTPAGAKTL